MEKVFESSSCMYFQCSLFEHWTMVIVFLFHVLNLSIRLTTKPYNLRKFGSWICEKHDQTTILKEGVLNNLSFSSFHLSACLSIRPILNVHFLNFLQRTFHHIYIYYKVTKPDFGKCCLGNWVHETNSDQKWNIWYFNKSNTIFLV